MDSTDDLSGSIDLGLTSADANSYFVYDGTTVSSTSPTISISNGTTYGTYCPPLKWTTTTDSTNEQEEWNTTQNFTDSEWNEFVEEEALEDPTTRNFWYNNPMTAW